MARQRGSNHLGWRRVLRSAPTRQSPLDNGCDLRHAHCYAGAVAVDEPLIKVGEELRQPRGSLAGHWINVKRPVNVRVGDLRRTSIPEVQTRTDLVVPQGISGPPGFLAKSRVGDVQVDEVVDAIEKDGLSVGNERP